MPRRKIDIDQRDARLCEFEGRAGQGRNRLREIRFVTDEHQALGRMFLN